MFDKYIKELDGKDTDLKINYIISRTLSITENDDAMRSYVLAKQVFDCKEVNKSDLAYIKEVINKDKNLTPFIKGQILVLIEEYEKDNHKEDNQKEDNQKDS